MAHLASCNICGCSTMDCYRCNDCMHALCTELEKLVTADQLSEAKKKIEMKSIDRRHKRVAEHATRRDHDLGRNIAAQKAASDYDKKHP